uniref:Uncharacterized protein n=1 Tax=Schizaphis graminum TaxID=13262 RepID=A0A2S2N8Q4_SCHGA
MALFRCRPLRVTPGQHSPRRFHHRATTDRRARATTEDAAREKCQLALVVKFFFPFGRPTDQNGSRAHYSLCSQFRLKNFPCPLHIHPSTHRPPTSQVQSMWWHQHRWSERAMITQTNDIIYGSRCQKPCKRQTNGRAIVTGRRPKKYTKKP